MSHTQSQANLSRKLAEASEQVVSGGRYMHYKQLEYTVLRVALREEDNEPCVVYQAAYGDHLVWIRPLSSWLESVTFPDGTQVPRFRRVN